MRVKAIPGWIWITGIGAAISLGGYLVASQITLRTGFPLDDAWIHQTYARNLSLLGQWAYLPGKTSAGSTSPLWTVLLSLGYTLKIPYFVWTFLLEGLILWVIAVVGELTFRSRFPSYSRIPWVSFFFILEWHLVWAAGSGMETLLFSLIILFVLTYRAESIKSWIILGLLTGLSMWVRPDGITLLGPVLFGGWLTGKDFKSKLASILAISFGFLGLFGPYMLFNRLLAGNWWPNTFYAKQMEYAVLQQIPLVERITSEAVLPFIGAGSVIIPGLVITIWSSIKKRDWPILLGLVWACGYIGLYSWRLPVTYQHGRYILPVMPILFLTGLVGLYTFLKAPINTRWHWIVSQSWKMVAILLLGAFWIIGAQSYAKDVAIINTEMVDTARWISTNSPPGSIIAAHDIGASGYFGNREIVDLAGLISPEVIPIMRNELALQKYLDQRKVDYLMTFPDWYTQLGKDKKVVFTGTGSFAPSLGQANMCVYLWALSSDK